VRFLRSGFLFGGATALWRFFTDPRRGAARRAKAMAAVRWARRKVAGPARERRPG
jgi:hypothetical protein